MEKIIQLLNYSGTILSLFFLIYVLLVIWISKKRYMSYLPLFIFSVLIFMCYMIRIFLSFSFLNVLILLMWIFQLFFWYRAYKIQNINKTIYNFIFKKDEQM